MKKILLLSSMIIASFSTTIIENDEIKLGIKSKNFKTDIVTLVKDKKLTNIIKKISEIDKISKNSSICKIPSYSIVPKYIYQKNGKRVFDSYEAKLHIKCKFKKEDFANFSKIVENISKYSFVDIGTIEPFYDKKKIDLKLKKLSYEKALNNAKEYSKLLKKECYVKRINSYPINRPYTKSSYRALKATLPVPQEKRKFTLSVEYEIECF